MQAIAVKGLTKRYRNFTAVNGISFSVQEGEFFAFLGENGAGKSTTIQMLCTILKKTAGDVSIWGHRLGEEDDAIRSKIGIVFQNSVLDSKLTVRENLLSRGSYYGMKRVEIQQQLQQFEDLFALQSLWNRKYEKLSGGQKRRIDILRALLHQPKILFLDEPTTGLDPKTRSMMWKFIDDLRKTQGMTIFLTTHYMEETKDADHVVILDHGEVIADGTPIALKNRYATSRLVWYAENTAENCAILENFSYGYDADHFNILFQGTITDFLYAHKDRITDFEILKGSMDDVFLQLTGKEFAS